METRAIHPPALLATPSATSLTSGEAAMTHLPKILRACVAVVALAAAACSTPAANGPEQVFDINERFPISVQPRMMTLRLIYNGQMALDENAQGQIARFAQDYLSHGSGSLAVAPPNGNQAVAGLVVDELVARGVG